MKDQQLQDNEQGSKCIETILCKVISKGVDTPYNWILIVATIIIWLITGGMFPYSTNQNFDMVTNMSSYMQLLSLAAIIYGLLKRNCENAVKTRKMLRLGLAVYILSFLIVIAMKNFGVIFVLGLWLIKPVGIFNFLLLVKTMWQIPGINQDNTEKSTKTNNKKKEAANNKK